MSSEVIWAAALGVFCTVSAWRTYNFYWLVNSLWCVLYLLLLMQPPTVSGIRELLLAVIFLLAFCGALGLYGLRLWNAKTRRKRRGGIFRALWVLFCLLLALTTLGQTDVLDALTALRAAGHPGQWLLLWLRLALLVVLLWQTGKVFAWLTDRLFSRKRTLVLINCHVTEQPGLFHRYYLSGVHNGQVAHFQLTRPAALQMKKHSALRLEVKEGLLGGLYVTEPPACASRKKAY